jgi:hypothetical protein
LPVSENVQRAGNDVSAGETSPSALTNSSDNHHIVKTTEDNHTTDRRLHEDDDEDDDVPLMTKACQKIHKAPKHVYSHTISKKELAGLGINSDSLKRKVKSTLSKSKNVDNQDDDEHPVTPSKASPQRAPKQTAKHSGQKIRLILNSNPFTPSPPGSPTPSPEPEGKDDTDGEYDSDGQPARKKQKKNTPSPTKSAKANAKAKNTISDSKRSLSAKNRTYTFPVAGTLSEASEADKMMFRLKGQGKSWKTITAEWGRMTGKQPGASSLSVRFIKLKEKFAKMGDPDVRSKIFFHGFALLYAPENYVSISPLFFSGSTSQTIQLPMTLNILTF